MNPAATPPRVRTPGLQPACGGWALATLVIGGQTACARWVLAELAGWLVAQPILDQVNLVVSDIEATVAFYSRLGLTIPDTDDAFQTHHRSAEVSGGADLDFDSTEFAQHWDKGWKTGVSVVVGFKVASRERVDAIYSDLTEAGYRGQQEPYDALWGARYAIVEDPDDNAVGIMSPVDPARRSDPDFP